MAKSVPAIFLDRDGTINVDHGYVHEIDNFEFIDGVIDAMRELKEMGYALVLVTNQSGIARGKFTEAQFETLTEWMDWSLADRGVELDGIYYCPHHPEHGIGIYKKKCHCRKPETGMFEMAERDLPEGIDKVHSYMIGDKRIDAQAGKNFGVTGVLVGTGYGAKEHAEDMAAGLIKEDGSCPAGGYDAYAETLLDAVRGILGGRI